MNRRQTGRSAMRSICFAGSFLLGILLILILFGSLDSQMLAPLISGGLAILVMIVLKSRNSEGRSPFALKSFQTGSEQHSESSHTKTKGSKS